MHLLMRSVCHGPAALLPVVLLALLASSSAIAGGMALTTQNGSQLGASYSGAAAAEDASVVYYNPAGLGFLEQGQVIGAATWVKFDAQFTNGGSTTAGMVPTHGADVHDGGEDRLIPVLYVAYPLSGRFAFGAGVSAPYGLATGYPADWVGRYHAIESELVTVNASLAAAWKVTSQLALGFGVDYQTADAELSNAIDIGLIGYANSIPGFAPGSADAHVRIEGDDARLGFNAGVLCEILPGTRVGVHYRSEMTHKLEGTARFTGVAGPFTSVFFDQKVVAPLVLPDVFSVSIAHRLTPELTVTADWSLWKWSSFDTLGIDFANPGTPDFEQPQDWKNASIVSAGVRWQRNNRLTLRAGFALNETPVPNAERRTARIPDSDRTWVSIGAGWQFNARIRGEIGYAHLFMKDASIANDDGAGHLLAGRYESSADILSVQLNWSY